MGIKNNIIYKIEKVKNLEQWAKIVNKKQWKDGKSAKEFAKYMLSNGGYLPPEIEEIIGKCPKNMEAITYPEKVTSFGKGFGRGHGRQHDALIISEDFVIGVEAKVDEPLGKSMGECDNENKEIRIKALSRYLYGDENKAKELKIKYQLLSASVGTLMEAERNNKKKSVLLFIIFNNEETDNMRENKKAIEDFIKSLKNGENSAKKFGEDKDITFNVSTIEIKIPKVKYQSDIFL